MAVNLSGLTTGTMNVNAGHERTLKAHIINQIKPIRGITTFNLYFYMHAFMYLCIYMLGGVDYHQS